MAKKKIIRKSNRTLNLFDDGGLAPTWGQQAKSAASNAFSSSNIGRTVGGIGSAVGNIVNAGIQNAQIADTSKIEGNIRQNQAYQVKANTNDELMQEWSAFQPMEGVSYRDVRGGSTGQRIGNTIGAVGSGASAGATVGGPIGAVVGAVVGLGSAIGGWISGNSKAKRKARLLNQKIDAANEKNLVGLEGRASNIDVQNDLNALANFSAYGGPINTVFAEGGGIHIKPENRGKFTALKKRTGKSSTWYKEHGTPAQRKMATFALNAAKWHANGGELSTHGGDFTNGVTIIGNGGTHEENPLEGVPMGIAPDGTPNLVEQGEVKFNNYIFSNRLFASNDLLKGNGLPTAYTNHSFADIAERLSKESSERPNDPISKRGLMSSMTRLRQAQEQVRAAEEEKNMKKLRKRNMFAIGGDTEYDEYADYYPEGYAEMEDEGQTLPTSKVVKPGPSWLRYAPVVGSGLGIVADAAGLTNKPDYSNADLIGRSVANLPEISYNPLGNYLTYKPLDRNYYLNKVGSMAGATRRAIVNQSGGNRANAIAGLLAADYNSQKMMGDLARQAEEYNAAQREKVETFNRGTNQFNSEMALKAAMANQENNRLRLQASIEQARMRDNIEARASAGRAANLTNFFDSLGDIGREEFSRNMINSDFSQKYGLSGRGTEFYKGENYTFGRPNKEKSSKKKSTNKKYLTKK